MESLKTLFMTFCVLGAILAPLVEPSQPPSAHGMTRIICQDGQLKVSIDGSAWRGLFYAEGTTAKCETSAEQVGVLLHQQPMGGMDTAPLSSPVLVTPKAEILRAYIEKHCHIRPGYYDIKCDQ